MFLSGTTLYYEPRLALESTGLNSRDTFCYTRTTPLLRSSPSLYLAAYIWDASHRRSPARLLERNHCRPSHHDYLSSRTLPTLVAFMSAPCSYPRDSVGSLIRVGIKLCMIRRHPNVLKVRHEPSIPTLIADSILGRLHVTDRADA